MKNIDVSVMNVLKNQYPELFGQYFNEMGLIPNPTLETRRKASEIFQRFSLESFDSFMQRYRNWISPSTLQRRPRNANLEIESLTLQKEQEFNVLSFLREKTLYRDYVYLDFELKEELELHKDEMLDPLLVEMVNKLHTDKMLEIRLNEILWKK